MSHVLSRPLTLISAPAGYGKTTLASAWLEGLDHPKAWLSLDENDNHLEAFLAYFLATVQSIFPDAFVETLNLFEAPNLPPIHTIVSSLSNDLFKLTQPFVVVLDDYSVIHDATIHKLFAELLQHPPPSMHLVLTCRHDPPLPINSLRAHHQIVEVRRLDLRFSRIEIETFMQNVLGVPLEEKAINILEEKTEGWVAGLRLAALSLIHSDDIEQNFASLEEDSRYILEYLAGEVISRLPQEIQKFLLSTSILERMCGPLCDGVVGLKDPGKGGQTYLEWLERANLFIVPLDGQQVWYRYHRLFREILKILLMKESSLEELSLLHARASCWFSENGYLEEATSHAQASGDESILIQLVDSHRFEAMNQERWQQIGRWLDLIPRRTIDERPELLMLEAWALIRSERSADFHTCLDRLGTFTGKINLSEAENRKLWGEMNTLRSQECLLQGDIPGGLALARSVLESVDLDLSFVRGTAWMTLASALYRSGDLNSALDTVYDGLREDDYHQNTFATRLLIALSSIYWMEENSVYLLQSAEYLLKLAHERDLPESMTWAHYFLGYAHYKQNDLSKAENHLGFVVRLPSVAHSFAYLQSVFGLAATYQAQGLDERAREVVEAAIPLALEKSNPAMVSEIQAFLAHLALMQGNSVEAYRWAMQCDHRFPLSSMPAFYSSQFSLVRVLIDQGTPESLGEAKDLLVEMQAHAKATNNTLHRIKTLALQALLQDALKDETEALDLLSQSVFMTQPGGDLRLYVDLGPRMASLLSRLHRQGTAPSYIKEILQAFPNHKPVKLVNGSYNLIEPLTDRELEILSLLAQRLSNKEIAYELVISPATVKRHTINIYQKLNTNSRREAVDVATAMGLFSLQSLSA